MPVFRHRVLPVRMISFHCDYETASKRDLKTSGAFRYAEDESTRILMFGIAKGDGQVRMWRFDEPESPESLAAVTLFKEAIDGGFLIYAHNALFEIAISMYRLKIDVGIDPPSLDQWRCTQALCRRSAVPPSLEMAANFLKLDSRKDAIGSKLIQVFSNQLTEVTLTLEKEKVKSTSPILEPVILWDWTTTVAGKTITVRAAWELFIGYCKTDVMVEREIHKALSKFELKGEQLQGFLFDLHMNVRGVPVDIPTLKKADAMIVAYKKKLAKRFHDQTGFGPKQNARVLEWAKARGYGADNLQSGTVEEELAKPEGMTPECRQALRDRSMLAFAAVDKVSAMLRWVCSDGRIRGAFTWYGAQKTGRWTSQGPQFQNMKKPPKWMKLIMAEIYKDLADGFDMDSLESFYGNPYQLLACTARYFVREEGRKVFDVDFAQVEARILPALIGCQRIVDKFIRGEDIYMDVAQKLNTTRDMGKVISLLCQFGGGWKAVKIPLKDKITEKEARKAVKVYRQENPEVVEAWKLFQDKFIDALNSPGKWVDVTEKIAFAYTRNAPFPRMLMRFPSGRHQVYPHPAADPITMVKREKEYGTEEWVRKKGHLDLAELKMSAFHTYELSFYGHVKGKLYGRVKTYGGDLLQTATQGTGLDFLMHGCIVAESRGFETWLAVHDQSLASEKGRLQEYIDALCTRPSWFKDFPLEADGHIADSYSKD